MALFTLKDADRNEALPADAVAKVGDEYIPRATYERALAAVAEDKRDPLDAADRRRVLERLVDEAVLIRHGLDSDLVQRSQLLRAQLVTAVLQSVRAETEARPIDEAEVQAFYRDHAARFRGPDFLHVRVLRVADRERAEAARKAWREGADFPELRAEYGGDGIPVPDAPLPQDKLGDYVGAGPAAIAAALNEGEIAEPVPTVGGFLVLRLVARRPAQTPPLSEVEEAVRHEMRRRAAEALLAERLAELRERYDVVVAEE